MDSRTAPGHPIRSGRRPPPHAFACPVPDAAGFANDLKLFATTFAAGFVFVSLYLF
jgi:hypothetical protein